MNEIIYYLLLLILPVVCFSALLRIWLLFLERRQEND